MKLCRVTGNLVATVKHPTYVGHKIMLVQPVDESGHDQGTSFVAVDLVQAGPGDRVLVMQEGNGVRQILKEQKLPIRSVIVGIVDEVDTVAPASSGGRSKAPPREKRR
ncbi:MAG: EutN/CcmL family microcompartment protein [Deltaproteobacteria bacterium]|nr:EutN/CcmL family microcompartment protein [Deltaproteobacteria bacterium]